MQERFGEYFQHWKILLLRDFQSWSFIHCQNHPWNAKMPK